MFNIPIDSSRQALSESAKVEQKYLFSAFTLYGNLLTFLQMHLISKISPESDSPDCTDYKNAQFVWELSCFSFLLAIL